MIYRAEIDGLRALAVIPVILFHAGFGAFSGGFVGVDVFFVISGYLITSIVVDDIDKNKFDLVGFYERRARRILPALFFFLFLALVFGFFYFPPHAFKDLGQSVFATVFFVSNVFFYIETDYFNNAAEMAPFLHTWSLSVEEQFYLFFPLLLLAVKRRSRVVWLLLLAVFVAASLSVAQFFVERNQPFAFYMIFTRLWELLVGAILAIYFKNEEVVFPKFGAEVFSWVGVLLIFVPVFFYDSETKFPGLAAVPPVLGAAMIILFARRTKFIGRVLSFPVFVNIGLLSYSLYLSHNVVFASGRNVGFSLDLASEKIVAIGVAVLLALFGFIFIERPARYVAMRRVFYLSAAVFLILFFATVGYYLHVSDGLKYRKLNNVAPGYRSQVVDADLELKRRSEVWSALLQDSDIDFSGRVGVKKVLIIGDSKSEDLYVSLVLSETEAPVEFRRIALDDTRMAGVTSANIAENADLEKFVSSDLFREADEVVVSATWQGYTNNRVRDFVLWLTESGKIVSVVSTANFNDVASLSYVVANRQLEGVRLHSYLFNNIRSDWQSQYFDLKKSLDNASSNLRFLEKLSAFCDFDEKTCNLKSGSDWFFYDSGHLTVEGAKFFGDYARKSWF